MSIGTILLLLLSFFGAHALVRHARARYLGRHTAIPEVRIPPTIDENLKADLKAVAQQDKGVLNPAETWPKEHRAVDTPDSFAIPHPASKRPNLQGYYGKKYRLPSGVIREVTGAVSDVEGTVYLYFGHGLLAYKAKDLRRIVQL